MIKRKLIGVLTCAAVLISALSLVACADEIIDHRISVEFLDLTANGNNQNATTVLTMTFSEEIVGLTAADIALSGVSGVGRGSLNRLSGVGVTPAVYTLGIMNASAGDLTVQVTRTGWNISPRSVPIFGALPTIRVEYNSLTHNGSPFIPAADGNPEVAQVPASELTVVFSQAMPALELSHITIAGVVGVTATAVNPAPAPAPEGTYIISITNTSAGNTTAITGRLRVSFEIPRYSITPSVRHMDNFVGRDLQVGSPGLSVSGVPALTANAVSAPVNTDVVLTATATPVGGTIGDLQFEWNRVNWTNPAATQGAWAVIAGENGPTFTQNLTTVTVSGSTSPAEGPIWLRVRVRTVGIGYWSNWTAWSPTIVITTTD